MSANDAQDSPKGFPVPVRTEEVLENDFTRKIIRKTRTAAILIVCLTIIGLLLLCSIALMRGFANLTGVGYETLAQVAEVGESLNNFVFNTRTKIRPEIANRPDITAEKARISEKETPANIEAEIIKNGGISCYIASEPVFEIRLEAKNTDQEAKQ